MSARYADVYSDAANHAERLWWRGKETKHEVGFMLGLTMASFQQVGSSLAATLSTVLSAPFSILAARHGTADISSKVESTLGQLALQQVGFSRLADIRRYLLQNSDLLD